MKSIRHKYIYISLVLLMNTVFADNLGVVGKTYPISEPDMIEWIKAKAAALMKSGEWQKIQNKAIDNAKQQINYPKAIAGISDATVTKTWYFTPIVTQIGRASCRERVSSPV